MRRTLLDVRGGSADVRGAQVPLAAVRLSINFNLNLSGVASLGNSFAHVDRGSLPFEQNGPKEDIDDLRVVVRICPL